MEIGDGVGRQQPLVPSHQRQPPETEPPPPRLGISQTVNSWRIPEQWVCPRCTLANAADAGACAACELRRVSARSSRAVVPLPLRPPRGRRRPLDEPLPRPASLLSERSTGPVPLGFTMRQQQPTRFGIWGFLTVVLLTSAVGGLVTGLVEYVVNGNYVIDDTIGLGFAFGSVIGVVFALSFVCWRVRLFRRLRAENNHQLQWLEGGPRFDFVDSGGHRHRHVLPAPEGLIRSLPSHKLSPEELEKVSAEYRSCTICLEEFTAGEEQRTLPCFHRFHSKCVDHWLRSSGSCPICRESVLPSLADVRGVR